MTPSPETEILRADASGVTLRMRVPAYRVVQITHEGRVYQRVEIPGYALSQAEGRPALPERGVMLGIPAGATPKLSIVRSERSERSEVEKVYLGRNYPYENPAIAAKAAVIAAVNQGQFLVSYIGHGAWNSWAAEKLLSSTDALGLSNAGRLPIWLAMTCWTGSFHAPNSTLPSALDVELVRGANGGAMATFSPTGLGTVVGHDYLQRGFLDALFRAGLERMGQAAQAAKLNLYTHSGQDHDLLNTFAVLGDPALRIAVAALMPTATPTATPMLRSRVFMPYLSLGQPHPDLTR